MLLKSVLVLLIGVIVAANAATARVNCSAGPPDGIDPQDCCQQPEKDHATMGKCFMMLGNSFGLPPNGSFPGHDSGSLPKGGQCASECLLKEWKVLKNGVVDVQTAIANVKKMLVKNTVWVSVFVAGIKNCAAKANNNKKKFAAALNGTPVDGTTNCSQYSGFFLMCLETYQVAHCPAKKFTSNPKCNGLKKFFKDCPTPPIF